MPFYKYECDTCDHSVEKMMKISDRDLPVGETCQECNQGKMIRPVEAPGFTDSVSLGRIKAPAEFRNLLSHIKKENPRSNINER